jgi:hypothetical protein
VCGDRGDACLGGRGKQFLSRQFEAKIAQELERPTTDKSTKALVQCAARHATRRREFAEIPGARRVGLDQIDRLLQVARQNSRRHHSHPSEHGRGELHSLNWAQSG